MNRRSFLRAVGAGVALALTPAGWAAARDARRAHLRRRFSLADAVVAPAVRRAIVAYDTDAQVEAQAPVVPRNLWGYQAFSEPSGWHVDAESAIGHALEAASVYISLAHPEQFPQEGRHVLDTGGTLYLNVTSQYANAAGDKIPIDYADIRAGLWDATLDAWAVAIRALGLPRERVVVTWQHEPTANDPQQPKTGDWSGPAYVATFNYVRDRLRADGVRALWGYFPTVSAFGSSNALDYYPGNSSVDVIGADCYQRSTSRGDFFTKVQRFVDFANTRGKPPAIGELGNDETDGTRPRWISDCSAYFLGLRNVFFVNWNAKPEFGLVPGTPEWNAWVTASAAWY